MSCIHWATSQLRFANLMTWSDVDCGSRGSQLTPATIRIEGTAVSMRYVMPIRIHHEQRLLLIRHHASRDHEMSTSIGLI